MAPCRPDLSLIAKARGIETNAPFYLVPVNMLKDIATGYQEAGPTISTPT